MFGIKIKGDLRSVIWSKHKSRSLPFCNEKIWSMFVTTPYFRFLIPPKGKVMYRSRQYYEYKALHNTQGYFSVRKYFVFKIFTRYVSLPLIVTTKLDCSKFLVIHSGFDPEGSCHYIGLSYGFLSKIWRNNDSQPFRFSKIISRTQGLKTSGEEILESLGNARVLQGF